MPLHLCSEWLNPVSTRHWVLIAVILPAEVTDDDYRARVVYEGMSLRVQIKWLKPMVGFATDAPTVASGGWRENDVELSP